MTGMVNMLAAWALSMIAYTALAALVSRSTGSLGSGFSEAVLGISVLLGVPTFLFAVIVGWPTMSFLTRVKPTWLVPVAASGVLAIAMVVLTAALPDGWRGAAYALTGYAAVLGFVWGSLSLLTARAS